VDRAPDKLPATTSRLIAMAVSLVGSPQEVMAHMKSSEADFVAYCAGEKEPSSGELDALIGLIVRQQGSLIAKNREVIQEREADRASRRRSLRTLAAKPDVLVADIPSLRQRLRLVLAGYECHYVSTIAEAFSALENKRFQLIIICVLFSESRMYELVTHIMNDDRYMNTPIVCLRGEEGVTDTQWKRMDLSVRAAGARFFLDLRKVPDTPRGNSRLSQLLLHLLLLEADMLSYEDDHMGDENNGNDGGR
jgi:hypothetical protein